MISIRKMVLNDIKQVCELESDNFAEPWQEKDFTAAFTNPNRFYMVAECDGIVVGNSGVTNILGEGEITNVVVREEFRRRNIARKMLESLIEEGKAQGIRAFTLEVRQSNQAAIHLYQKLGFIEEGIRKNFYSNPSEHAIIMWKR